MQLVQDNAGMSSWRLAAEVVARYRQEGFLAPLRVMSELDMSKRLEQLSEIEARMAGRLAPARNIKAHLLLPFLWDLVHDPRVLDPVSDLLGPDLLCWAAGFFDKRPGEPYHVPWHQDATYWGLSSPEAVTAWIAFTPSGPDNGCMRVSPRTHGAPVAHKTTQDGTNMLPGREAVLVDVDEAAAVDIVLQPGEMSLHDVLLVHGSRPNRSDIRRCGFAIRYVPGHVRRMDKRRGTATLVRGRDHGHFEQEQAPEAAFAPAAMERYNVILRRWMRDVFDEITHAPSRKPAG